MYCLTSLRTPLRRRKANPLFGSVRNESIAVRYDEKLVIVEICQTCLCSVLPMLLRTQETQFMAVDFLTYSSSSRQTYTRLVLSPNG